jgi:hypothetical protein
MWIFLGIATAILLVLFWNNRNFVWGGFTFGLTIGLLWKIFSSFGGDGASWSILIKAGIVAALIGFFLEALEFIADYWVRKNKVL